jgi:thymidylate synthase (FAD)
MNIVPMTVTLIDSMGSDLSVVNAARVSFHKESDWEYTPEILEDDGWSKQLSEKDTKLINYLAKHGHWTPFGHAFLSFRIKAPIFVARQLVKHQVGLVWNEVSRRYVDDEPEFWLPSSEGWRGKPVNAKQGSTGSMPDPDMHCLCSPQLAMRYCWDSYKSMIEQGYAPEQARMVLPQNTMTEWIWSGSLAAFARVCKLRLDPHSQQETREVAQQIHDQVPTEFQHSWKALLG